ncbi:MAG: hypothetical protein U0133_09420 [Gemmatimonadales bacterium]
MVGTTNPLRRYVTEEARRHILTVSDAPEYLVNGKRRGADKLRQIFTEACLVVPEWSKDNLRALETPGNWLNVNGRGGTTDSKVAVHWCGIFATFVLRKVGLNVKWRAGIGIENIGSTGFLDRRNRGGKDGRFDPKAFAPGDVCVIPRANHHFIVVDAPEGSDAMRCIAGNGSKQQIEWQTHSRGTVVTHYAIAWDPFASRL